MRHFHAASAVAALPYGVVAAATRTRLVALPRFADGIGARLLRTPASTVALTMVAGAADEHRCAAAGAEVASSGWFHRQ